MKYLINIFLTQLIAFTSFAQGNFEKYNVNVEFISESRVSNGDGGVKLFYTSQAENNYKFKILARVSRNEKGKSDQYAEVTYLKLSYVSNGNTSLIADNLILNFVPDGQTQSGYKEFSIEIPSSIQTDGKIIGEFYTKNNSTSIKEIKAINTPLIAKVLLGPSKVCSEGIFSFGGSETVIIENHTGIATLTSLGNNKWKVTRIGQATGIIKLTSTSNGKTFTNNIIVGAIINGNISGISTIFPGKYQDYTLILNDNIANYENITFGIPDGMAMQILANNKVRLTAERNYVFAPGETEHTVTLNVTATIPGCGTASIEFPITVINPNPTPIN